MAARRAANEAYLRELYAETANDLSHGVKLPSSQEFNDARIRQAFSEAWRLSDGNCFLVEP
jgi:hypothetical protein